MKKIFFYNQEHTKCLEYNTMNIPLKTIKIKDKCFDYFRDADPCIIHINHVTKKVLIEINDLISNIGYNNYFQISDIEILNEYIDVPQLYTIFIVKEC